MPDIFDIIPFQYLGRDARERLTRVLQWKDWAPGALILEQGDDQDDRVFLLEAGTVDVIDRRRNHRVNTITSGHYFGERLAMFGTPRAVEIRAQTACRTASMSGEVFVELLRTEPAVAHALTFILRDKQGAFQAFSRFQAEVRLGSAKGHIIIHKLLSLYRRLEPALHRHCNSDRIDFDALTYAIRRLPDNVSRTFVWFVTDDCPPHYREAASRMFEDVTPAARRRTSWEMMPGKSLVLLRDGQSDLLDMVTCLCLYAVEARKLRRRLRDADVLCSLSTDQAMEGVNGVFSPDEVAALERLWPGEVAQRLAELSLHHEDITIHSFRRTNNYNSAHAETWTKQIAQATRRLLGKSPWELDEGYEVHVISSNTHSVTNCLSPWLAENQHPIRDWGQRVHPELFAHDWTTDADLSIALLRGYLAAHPEQRTLRRARDADVAVHLDETAFTGIAVQLFDLARLAGVPFDPDVPHPTRPGLIVNIDYAFGQQAEPIIANLVNLFGRRIRSINILGKAGGMRGERGDLMVAEAFVSQLDDALLCPPIAVDLPRLKARIPSREIRSGRVLTVLGTVLQNDRLLHTYDKLWDCIGLEMEGSFYCRQILESRELGLLDPDVALRFLYYISDLPLRHEASLAAKMTPAEGIPPLYATTREVLTAIFAP